MEKTMQLPVIDLASTNRISTANSIRQACLDCGFFYLINHGVDDNLLKRAFEESKKFYNLPLEEKMKLSRKQNRGYSPLYAEKHKPELNSKGDSKENFYIGPLEKYSSDFNLNQWPSEVTIIYSDIRIVYNRFENEFSEVLPTWRPTMESYYERVLDTGKKLISLLALALNLDEDFFVKVGAFNPPMPFLRLLHYPGDLSSCGVEIIGSSAHSDYGMMTLLASDGVAGLQICRDKSKVPLIWEDVKHIDGAFVVNIGDMTERWTNGLFRSTLHRVMPVGRERYSIAFFLDPNPDCIVECLKSCCSESNPPRFPPIRSGDYLNEKNRLEVEGYK